MFYRETQRVSPRQLTSTPAQALQALHGSQNRGNVRSPSSESLIGNNMNTNSIGSFNLETPNSASSSMVAAASAALSAAAALDPLLQVNKYTAIIYIYTLALK